MSSLGVGEGAGEGTGAGAGACKCTCACTCVCARVLCVRVFVRVFFICLTRNFFFKKICLHVILPTYMSVHTRGDAHT